MTQKSVSVIIPTYNRLRFLPNTIKTIKEQNFSWFEIIIVDNSCLKDVRNFVETESKNVDISKYFIKYIPEPSTGLHIARHTGAKAASGGILIFLDDDILAEPNLVFEHFKHYSEPKIGCVGGKILPKWQSPPPSWVSYLPSSFLSILDHGEQTKEVTTIYGCNFSIRKQILFDLGGFNPDSFGDQKNWYLRGDGEIGLCRKVHSANYKVIYDPHAVVWHIIPKERLTLKYFQSRAFKFGIERSFYHYRYLYPMYTPKLIIRASIFLSLYFSYNLVGSLPKLEKSYPFFKLKIWAHYYLARAKYEAKIALNKNLRQFIRKESWLYQ